MRSEPWVVSLAAGEPRFQLGVERLGESLRRVGFDGRFEAWSTLPPGCPAHLDVPFAFKPYCLAEARDAGAELALWLDSSCVAVRRLERIADGLDYEAVKLNRGRRVSRDPRVRGHRHDQTVAGPLAYRLGMHLTNHGLSVSPHVPRVASPRTLIVNLRAARRRWPALARRLVRPARR